MKTMRRILGGLLIAGVATSAQAIPIQFIDTYTPTDPILLEDQGDAHSYSHYITPPSPDAHSLDAYIGGVLTPGAGYDSATDTLLSGSISFFFSGGSDRPPWENGQFDLYLGGMQFLDGEGFATSVTIDDTVFDIGLITGAGLLSVSIERSNAAGSVYFTQSILDVVGERREIVAVSEPGAFGLLALGFAAIRLFRRRLPS
jgi:hypothetical protein